MSDKLDTKAAHPGDAKKPGEVKGMATYLLKVAHYRDGVMYEAGTKVTVSDEKPSKKWQRVPYDKTAPVLAKRILPKEAAELAEAQQYEEAMAEEATPKPGLPPAPTAKDAKRPNEKGI